MKSADDIPDSVEYESVLRSVTTGRVDRNKINNFRDLYVLEGDALGMMDEESGVGLGC